MSDIIPPFPGNI